MKKYTLYFVVLFLFSALSLSAQDWVNQVKENSNNKNNWESILYLFPCTPPTVTISGVINVKCTGASTGSATANPVGGVPPYIYAWSPLGGNAATANGLSAGTYTVSVTESGGCTGTAQVTITEPATALGVTNGSIVEVKCNGANTGSVKATATGGTGAYTYSWAPVGGTNATASNLTAATYTITVTDANGCVVTASTSITQPLALNISINTITNVSCSGGNTGSITTNSSGGAGAYTYNWTPVGGTNSSATNLSAATYTVTLKDANGCTATASATVSQPAATLAVTTSGIVNEKCNGGNTGAATANPSGGTAPYTFAWAPSGGTNATASNLTAGTYTVTVTDANGCTGTASAIITQPTVISIITSTTPTGCLTSIGTATATPSGGTGAYTYNWAPSGGTLATATGLSAGTYTVTVKDANNCSVTAAATVNTTGGETVSISGVTNVSCRGGNNGSISTNTVGGTAPYTYVWTPSGGSSSTASNLSAGTYTVTVTDAGGCISTASATVTQPAVALAVSTGSIVNVKCNGASTGSATANATGGTGAYTYAWTPSGGTNAIASNLSAGTYTVTVHDANGCSATASAIITQPAAALSVTTGGIINDKCNGGSTGSATANPLGGTVPYTFAWTPSGGTNATASNLSAGTYTVTVTDANGCTATASAIITQPLAIAIAGSSTPSACGGTDPNGTATASPSGGTPAYTFSWAPSGGTNATATGLTAGTYTVTVTDANACTATAAVIVGSTALYTYLWTPVGGTNSSATNLSAATYTVTVHDANGCISTASSTITQPTLLTVSTGSIVNVKCNGNSTGSATATAGGGTGAYTYAWTPSGGTNATASNLSAGTYTITVHDANGCSVTASATITQPALALAVVTGAIVNEQCNGASTGSITSTPGGGTAPYTFAWTPSGGTNATASNLSAGTYTVT